MLSRNFRLQKVGDLNWLQTNYVFSNISLSIDELIILDVSRENRNSETFCEQLKILSQDCFIPIAAGGGVQTLEHASRLLRSGADKIVINSSLYTENDFVNSLARQFGQQCIVASVDVKQHKQGGYHIWADNGRNCLSNPASYWLKHISKLPLGEIYLNSMDRDGTGQGYDLKLLDLLPYSLLTPIILAGGAGNSRHLAEGLSDPRVDAVATAHLFNFIGDGLFQARNKLIAAGIELPVWTQWNNS
jgi:imidazole glycerol-phosphate synthase subunit HisF